MRYFWNGASRIMSKYRSQNLMKDVYCHCCGGFYGGRQSGCASKYEKSHSGYYPGEKIPVCIHDRMNKMYEIKMYEIKTPQYETLK